MTAPLAPRACRVTAQHDLGAEFRLTELCCDPIARGVSPGQFVMVRIPGGLDPLLGRPFSVFSVDGDRISLVYNIVGRGTARMAAARPGDDLLVLGPLGHGFDLTAPPDRAVLVSGGIGIAGLYLLADALARRSIPTRLLYGARSGRDLVTADRFAQLGHEVLTATDDGSAGHHGFVTELLERDLARASEGAVGVYACGPSPMMRRVRDITIAAGTPCQLALEAHMACGFGVCLGCVVPSARVPGTYKLVCSDGPCMDAAEVIP